SAHRRLAKTNDGLQLPFHELERLPRRTADVPPRARAALPSATRAMLTGFVEGFEAADVNIRDEHGGACMPNVIRSENPRPDRPPRKPVDLPGRREPNPQPDPTPLDDPQSPPVPIPVDGPEPRQALILQREITRLWRSI